MTLHSFDREINPYIKEMAFEVASERSYRDFEKEDQTYRMTVSGFFDYHPEVTLGKRGKILSHTCDCHYDKGPVCQHVAALLFVIRSRGSAIDDDMEQSEFRAMLMKHSKEELVDIITSLTEDDPGFLATVRMKAGNKEERLDAYREQARDSLEIYRKKKKTLEPDDFDHLAMIGIYEALDEARRTKEYDFGFSLMIMIFDELLDLEETVPVFRLPQSEYDDLFIVLEEIMPEISTMEPEAKKKAFDELITLIQHFDSLLMDKVGSRVLTMLAALTGEETKDEYLDMLRHYEEQAKSVTDRDDLAMSRLTYLQRHESAEVVENFIEEHMDNPMIRYFAIQKAMMDEDFDQAVLLAKEGMNEPSRPEWDPMNFELNLLAAELRLENEPEIKRILKKRLLGGEDWAYDPYMSLYEGYERDMERQDILEHLKSSKETIPAFVSICLIEEMYEDVMTYIEKNPEEVKYLHEYFPKDYESRIDSCFYEAILDQAENVKSEDDEEELVELLEEYQSAFEDKVHRVIDVIKNSQLRRTLRKRFKEVF